MTNFSKPLIILIFGHFGPIIFVQIIFAKEQLFEKLKFFKKFTIRVYNYLPSCKKSVN